jgi:hypothetical protein
MIVMMQINEKKELIKTGMNQAVYRSQLPDPVETGQ